MSTASNYLALTKPRLLPLVLFSGLPAMVLAAGEWPDLEVVGIVLFGIVLAAGAANSLNSYLERDLDARMERTQSRPLPSRRLAPRSALLFGMALGVSGTGLLWLYSGPMAALIAVAGIAWYVFIYTLWLKPRTSFAVVAGGVAGAIAPLIADAAVNGSVGAGGWLLFTIIFMWQPPHFYAIALNLRDDYSRAGFPMLHDAIGEHATRVRIIAWVVALIPVTLLPVLMTPVGLLYGAVAGALGVWFLYHAVRLYQVETREAARRFFLVSLVYLMAILSAMIVDLASTALAGGTALSA